MRRTKRFSMEQKKARWGWIFVAPSLVFFALFSFYPIFNAFYLSFFRKNLLSLKPPTFIGFGNYTYLFRSSLFRESVVNTAIFTFGAFVPLLVLSLVLAAFIMSRKRFQKLYQMILYSPAALSSVVAALIWLLIFDPRGLANQGSTSFWHVGGELSLAFQRRHAPPVYRHRGVWKYVGYFTVIFVAGIGAIPHTLHEAALIDGADRWQDFWHITFPLLKPTTLLVSVMAMIQCLKTFSTQYLFTKAGAPTRPIVS